jgi:hypothetical protein
MSRVLIKVVPAPARERILVVEAEEDILEPILYTIVRHKPEVCPSPESGGGTG